MRTLVALASLCVTLCLGAVSRGGPVTLTDTTFRASDWNAAAGSARSPSYLVGSVTPTVSVTQSAAPGSPSLLVSLGHSFGGTAVAVANNVWSYTPSVSGAIDSFDFRISQQWRDNIADLPWRVLIVQNGKYYGSAGQYRALYAGGAMAQYKVFSGQGLTADHFYEQGSTWDTLDSSSHPVFDASGGSMRFGLLFTSLTGGSYTWKSYHGEYTVVLNAQSGVPEIDPAGIGSALAVVAGAVGLLERRRRR